MLDYIYTVYSRNNGRKLFVTSDFDEIEKLSFRPHIVHIDVQRRPDYKTIVIASEEDLEEFRSTLERAAAWEPNPDPTQNVKNQAALNKPVLSPVPAIAFFAVGAAMKDGADKYGRFNWRTTEVTSSIFYDAMLRHLLYWYSGEDHAPDSKIHHLAHLMAGAAIILDAELKGVLNDDRNKIDIENIMKILKGNE
jgi:hypothetical protein